MTSKFTHRFLVFATPLIITLQANIAVHTTALLISRYPQNIFQKPESILVGCALPAFLIPEESAQPSTPNADPSGRQTPWRQIPWKQTSGRQMSEHRHAMISLICMSTHKAMAARCLSYHQAAYGQPAIRALAMAPLRRLALSVLFTIVTNSYQTTCTVSERTFNKRQHANARHGVDFSLFTHYDSRPHPGCSPLLKAELPPPISRAPSPLCTE